MSDRQEQRVAAHGTAIMSAGDTTINQGVGPEEIKAIVEGLADQLPRMAAVATSIVEERLKSFKEEVIGRFDQDGTAKRSAFEDPDFIEVVADAQRGYARTGKAESHATLIDLIAERSRQKSGERISYVLNEAVSVTAKLTSSELAELALAFAVRSVRHGGLSNLESFGVYHQALFLSLADQIEVEQSSYNYLVAQRCATISMGEISLLDCWRQTYPGLFMKGLPADSYRNLVGGLVEDDSLFRVSLMDGSGVQVNAMDQGVFEPLAAARGLSPETAKQVWDQATNNLADDAAIMTRLSRSCPLLKTINDKWQNSALKHLDLTALGLAIGHTRMSQIPSSTKADISIWVN